MSYIDGSMASYMHETSGRHHLKAVYAILLPSNAPEQYYASARGHELVPMNIVNIRYTSCDAALLLTPKAISASDGPTCDMLQVIDKALLSDCLHTSPYIDRTTNWVACCHVCHKVLPGAYIAHVPTLLIRTFKIDALDWAKYF